MACYCLGMNLDGKQAARCRDVGLAIGWLHPFFLIPLSHLKFVESDKTRSGSMEVSTDGVVTIDPSFTARLSDRQLAGAVCHEIMHLMLMHSARMGSRDPKRWNIATDLAINGALNDMGVELPQGVLMPPRGEVLTAEEWYTRVQEQGEDKQSGADGSVGKGCGPTPGQGKSGQGEGEGEGEGSGDSPGSESPDWEVVAHQAKASARGTESMRALGPLLSPKPAAVAWRTLLRSTFNRVAAQGGRDMQSATRRNRRSPAGVILPGWMSTKPTIAVVIDTSGSMSDEMLQRAVTESIGVGQAVGARVFLALHDSRCYHAGWIDTKGGGAEKIGRLVTHRGGTDAAPAYERVQKERAKFDVMVHLTDGELGQWPALPVNVRRLVAGIINVGRNGYNYVSEAPAGSTVVKVEV